MRKRGKRLHLRQPKNNYSGWLFIVGGFAQRGQVVFRPGLFLFRILSGPRRRLTWLMRAHFPFRVFQLKCAGGIKRSEVDAQRYRCRRAE